MFYVRAFALVLALSSCLVAEEGRRPIVVDCARGASLARAVMYAEPNSTLSIFGTCKGAVNIITDGLILNGNGSATVTASNSDVITVNGVQRVQLNNITVTGGANGVVVENN